MKNLFQCIALGAVSTLLYSCASTQMVDTRPRFHEAAGANVVLKFNSWDYISMIQPDYRDNGFQHQIKRDELTAALDRFNVARGTAVVVMGWTYDTRLPEVLADWKSVLRANGFQRLVVLRMNSDD